MSHRPIMMLVHILQQHGLSVEALEELAQCCERQRTGSMTLHYVDGVFKVLEQHSKRKIGEQERCLTKMSE